MIFTRTRESFIPAGAVKVSDKASSAVAYVYTTHAGKPAAMGFQGRAAKPAFCFRFASLASREAHVRRFFDDTREREARRRRDRAAPHMLQAGHVLVSTWGYEQTNVDYYQVTKLIGEHMVEIRPIGATTIQETGWAQGRSIPLIDEFKGEAMRKRVANNAVKIEDYAYARLWEGKPMEWSAYH